MQRNNLASLVAVMFALLMLAFLFALVRGLSTPHYDSADRNTEEFSTIEVGQTVIRRESARRVWLSRFSELQRQQLTSLESHLVDPDSGCDINSSLCGLVAATGQAGIELVYAKDAPPQLPAEARWIGGYVDPTSGAVFDLLGRAYRLNRESDQQRLTVVDLTN